MKVSLSYVRLGYIKDLHSFPLTPSYSTFFKNNQHGTDKSR